MVAAFKNVKSLVSQMCSLEKKKLAFSLYRIFVDEVYEWKKTVFEIWYCKDVLEGKSLDKSILQIIYSAF